MAILSQLQKYVFCILDHKVATWSIDAIGSFLDIEQTKKIAEELKCRIENTCKKLDKTLQPELQAFIGRKTFFLQNSYSHLRNLYDYY